MTGGVPVRVVTFVASGSGRSTYIGEPSPMTTAYERTKAVLETRKLLPLRGSPIGATTRDIVRDAALLHLRHYPLDIDLEISAVTLPEIWVARQR
ncbi:BPSL0761 family protein [Burkholderia cepacia]|uniref:BPSL0761 family protein n=2 Tax=Burkholderia cepacia TaxID=292 RepID=UPI00299E52A1|nr:BPSL0761 family protein [Burkholderia cepacia]